MNAFNKLAILTFLTEKSGLSVRESQAISGMVLVAGLALSNNKQIAKQTISDDKLVYTVEFADSGESITCTRTKLSSGFYLNVIETKTAEGTNVVSHYTYEDDEQPVVQMAASMPEVAEVEVAEVEVAEVEVAEVEVAEVEVAEVEVAEEVKTPKVTKKRVAKNSKK